MDFVGMVLSWSFASRFLLIFFFSFFLSLSFSSSLSLLLSNYLIAFFVFTSRLPRGKGGRGTWSLETGRCVISATLLLPLLLPRPFIPSTY